VPGIRGNVLGVIQDAVGIDIDCREIRNAGRDGFKIWFKDLGEHRGPEFTLSLHGLRRHKASLHMGKFAAPCVEQMRNATLDRLTLARAFIRRLSVSEDFRMVPNQSIDDFLMVDGLSMDVSAKSESDPRTPESFAVAANLLVIPMIAAMAEMIGYDDAAASELNHDLQEAEMEGALLVRTVTTRERSRRNRTLALATHGSRCCVCQFESSATFGNGIDVIEVHHLQPLSSLGAPRPYDPVTDLVPVCPTCHRALHARKPIPYSVEELRGLRK
jgi:5-methylcytosine-specific restriction protein A